MTEDHIFPSDGNPAATPPLNPETGQPPNPDPTLAGPAPAPDAPKPPTFAELGLRADVMQAIEEMGFTDPMPVQAKTYGPISEGRDLMVQSRTGSGKTAAFGIPFVNAIVNPDDKFVQAIVLLPTRELALQVAAEVAKIAVHRPVTVVPVYGGAPMGRQVEQLRDGGQIVCGTPGRVLDHLRRGTLRLDRVRCAVLDECDEMLSMGFQEDIEAILERTPAERQTLLFSATVPEGIQRLARRFLRNPEFLKLSGDYISVNEIRHLYYSIPGVNRENELLQILAFEDPKSAIIFCNTREETGRVAAFLRTHGHDAEAISSDLSQTDRERVLGRMRVGGIKFLVATDVAARGIDIENLSHVFNYSFPDAPEIYVHRTGRTGRAGKHGTAVSLIGPTEVGSFYYLKLLYKIKPEERALPSEAEIRSHREGERILVLRQALHADPGGDWRALARRLMGAVDGERLIAALLAQTFATVEGMPPAPVAPSPVFHREPASVGTRPIEARRHEGPRHEGPRHEGPRHEGRDRPHSDRPHSDRPRDDRPRGRDRDRPRFGDRDRGGERPGRRPERRGPPTLRNDPPPAEREFWEVWSEEKAHAAPGTGEPPAGGPPSGGPPSSGPFSSGPPSGGSASGPRDADGSRPEFPAQPQTDVARLYLNLGRKDGASTQEVRDLLTAHAGDIGVSEIDVMNTHTYINVAPADADRVAAALTGKELAGRQLVCEPAKPRRR